MFRLVRYVPKKRLKSAANSINNNTDNTHKTIINSLFTSLPTLFYICTSVGYCLTTVLHCMVFRWPSILPVQMLYVEQSPISQQQSATDQTNVQ